jgi:hypothetical protein
MSRPSRLPALLAAVLLALPAWARAAAPDFSGTWLLDHQRSDDAQARVEKAAGPGQVKEGGASGLTWLPELNTRSEVERVELRDWLLAVVSQLERLEVQQSASEIKLYHGDEIVRIFYFGRESVRNDGRGRKLRGRTRWQGEQLVLEEEGEKDGAKVVEIMTLVPSVGQLLHVVRLENKLLKQPLELKLVYQRDPTAK